MEDSAQSISQQLQILIKEWMTAESDLNTLSAEIREKRKRAKAVRGMITQLMKGNNVGQLNISSGQVIQRTHTKPTGLSQKLLISSLTEFFSGDKAMADKCLAFINSRRPLKEVDTLEMEARSSH